MHTHKTSQNVLNSDKRTEWRLDGPTPRRCVWEMHSVWGWDKTKGEGVVLHENYFTRHPTTGRKVWLSLSSLLECFMIIPRLRWYMDFYYPILKRWAERVHSTSVSGVQDHAPVLPDRRRQ
jgi:hypothetical protein